MILKYQIHSGFFLHVFCEKWCEEYKILLTLKFHKKVYIHQVELVECPMVVYTDW